MKTSEKMYPTVFTLLMIVMGFLALYTLLQSDWSGLFVISQAILISSIPYFLERKFSINTPYVLRTGFVLFMFSTLVLGEIADLYNTFWWWDIVLHSISSAGITIIGFIIMTVIYRDRDLKSSPWLTSFLVFSLAMSMAVLWEVYEFVIDLFFDTDSPMQPSNTDTMTDMLVAIVGSLVVCFYGFKYIKRQHAKTMVEETIEEGKLSNL